MYTNSATALRPYLSRLAMHSTLAEVEQKALLALPFKTVRLRSGKDLTRPGEHLSHSCFVAQGLVARFAAGRDGHRQITALHIPGDMPDLHSAIRPGGIGGLTTLIPSTVLQVPHSAVLQLAAEYPSINQALWRDCLMDAAVLMDWLVNVGRRGARSRVAHLFCEMAVRYSQAGDRLERVPFSVTQQQLGDIVATTSVHVNRVLKTLRDDGIVTLRGGEILIADWQRLAEVGEFDAAYLIGDKPR